MKHNLDLTFSECLELSTTLILIRNTRKELGYSPWDISDYILIKQALSGYYVELVNEKRITPDQETLKF